jgi:hypothetical protein
MRPVTHRAVAATLMLTVTMAACATHETMGRPPSAGQIARINTYADDHGPMRVSYDVAPPSCVGYDCQTPAAAQRWSPRTAVYARRIEPIGEGTVALQLRDGGVQVQPLVSLDNVMVRNRPRGALIGAGVGAALSLGFTLLGLLLIYEVRPNDPPEGANTDCGKLCVTIPATMTVMGGIVGAVIGYSVAARRVFDFGPPVVEPGR